MKSQKYVDEHGECILEVCDHVAESNERHQKENKDLNAAMNEDLKTIDSKTTTTMTKDATEK